MKNFLLLCLFTFCVSIVYGQEVETFENFGLKIGEFLNGSDGEGAFQLENAVLNNDYNADWDSWSGWAISADDDVEDGTYLNQYSSISGAGYDGSDAYAVAFSNPVIDLTQNGELSVVEGFYINNTTYAYKTILDGNDFSKKFGGVDGTDKDYFRLHIMGFSKGETIGDTITFYLADYRSSDPEEDYIVKDWTWIDLKQFGNIDSLKFAFESSDVGQFGINTPLYFAIDNLSTGQLSGNENLVQEAITIYPNPTTEILYIDNPEGVAYDYEVISTNGQVISQGMVEESIDVKEMPIGSYVLRLKDKDDTVVQKPFVKR